MDFTAGSLFASLLVSSIGLALFIYGKKQQRAPQLVSGLVLMIYPYFVSGVVAMIAIGTVIVTATWLATRMGW